MRQPQLPLLYVRALSVAYESGSCGYRTPNRQVWYKLGPMFRRRLIVTLLVILSVQMLGMVIFASSCPEPCPDDTENASCPPACTLCSICTHGQRAIVEQSSGGPPVVAAQQLLPSPSLATSSPVAADIFHVPLFG